MRLFDMNRRRHTAPVMVRALTGCALLLALMNACTSEQDSSPALPTPATDDRSSTSSPRHTDQTGVARGQLLFVGGPAPGSPRPLRSGRVDFSGNTQVGVRVGHNGNFSASLPQGTYEVTGRSKQFGSGSYECRAAGPIDVISQTTTRIDVYCQVK